MRKNTPQHTNYQNKMVAEDLAKHRKGSKNGNRKWSF